MKSKIYKDITLVILVWVIALINLSISYANDNMSYESMLSNLEKLEEYAVQYKAENKDEYYSANDLILIYIRTGNASYISTQWDMLGGSRSENFEAYVLEKDKENDTTASELKQLTTITLPTGEETDAVHMFATMNLYSATSADDSGGWAGDIVDLAQMVKNQNSSNTATVEELLPIAEEKFGTGSFSNEDLIADLDGYYFMNSKLEDPKKSFATIIREYYELDVTPKIRAANFIKKRFPNIIYADNNSYRSAVYEGYYHDVFLGQLIITQVVECSKGLRDGSQYRPGNLLYPNQVIASNYVFADYLYKIVTADTPNETEVVVDYINESISFPTDCKINTEMDFTGADIDNNNIIDCMGRNIYIRRERDEVLNNFNSSEAIEIQIPNRPVAPTQPVQVLETTGTTIKIELLEGLEYSLDGTTWQTSDVFENLTPNTTYTIYSRVKATTNSFKSLISEQITSVTTKETVFLSSLIIKNSITGEMADKNKIYTFSITFSDADSSYNYTINENKTNGADENIIETGKIKSGDSITLADNQSITINKINTGVEYNIVEIEANTEDYTTTASNNSGVIQKDDNIVTFINYKGYVPTVGVNLDIVPFILILIIAILFLIFLILFNNIKNKRRYT